MWVFFSRFKKLLLVVFLALFPIILLVAQNKNPDLRGSLSSPIVSVASLIQRNVLCVTGYLSDKYYRYITSIGNIDELNRLKTRVSKMALLETYLYEARLENLRLHDALGSKRKQLNHEIIHGRVIGKSAFPLSRMITINKGANHGIRRGDAVIGNEGAVGQVISVSRIAAEILLVSDSMSAIDVMPQTSRAHGILRGRAKSNGHLEVNDFDHLRDIWAGDVVVTSGIGTKFPVGVPVGEISKVYRVAGGTYLRAEIKPFIDFANLENVQVLTSKGDAEPWEFSEILDHELDSTNPFCG